VLQRHTRDPLGRQPVADLGVFKTDDPESDSPCQETRPVTAGSR
jgi:hypothetical protein